MTPDDTGHDAAADLPWDDDAPLLPYPVIATDPDPGAPMPTFPGLPVSAFWPDHEEELAALREFRADYDRLMSTEGQSHGEAIAALSGVLASVRQRPDPDEVDRRCAELREALTPTDYDGPLARAHIADMLELVDMIEVLNAENRVLVDRVTAAEGRLELAAMGREGVPRG